VRLAVTQVICSRYYAATLGIHIRHILNICASNKMIWIAAPWIVAGVHDDLGALATIQAMRKAMRKHGDVNHSEYAVPSFCLGSSPFVAPAGFNFNLAAEAIKPIVRGLQKMILVLPIWATVRDIAALSIAAVSHVARCAHAFRQHVWLLANITHDDLLVIRSLNT
jgi:hypothetical protein